MSRCKYWCLECRDRTLTHKCSIHGEFPVFHCSHKLRIPKYKNRVRFRTFVRKVHIFFNMVRDEQKPLLDEVAKELKLTGINVNGRIL